MRQTEEEGTREMGVIRVGILGERKGKRGQDVVFLR